MSVKVTLRPVLLTQTQYPLEAHSVGDPGLPSASCLVRTPAPAAQGDTAWPVTTAVIMATCEVPGSDSKYPLSRVASHRLGTFTLTLNFNCDLTHGAGVNKEAHSLLMNRHTSLLVVMRWPLVSTSPL